MVEGIIALAAALGIIAVVFKLSRRRNARRYGSGGEWAVLDGSGSHGGDGGGGGGD